MTTIKARVADAVAALERVSNRKILDGYDRYGITVSKAFGVEMNKIQSIGKTLGRDHELALGLWETGWYEARLLCAYIDEPARVTSTQMDKWARDFDNWGVCDTLCFALFDRTPHAWRKIDLWSARKGEFQKRAAFALLASIGVHDKTAPDAPFLEALELVRRESDDDRNFVKKGVNWALRVIGLRNRALNDAAMLLSRELAASDSATARWIGKDALRQFAKRPPREKTR